MNRRAQFQHVFTFIMLIIIAGVVLLLGYRFISSLFTSTCEAEQLDFINTLRSDLRSYAAYGTIKTAALSAPCGAARLCFVDATAYGTPDANGIYPGGAITSANPAIRNAVASPTTPPANIFLLDDKGAATPLQLFGDKIRLAAPSAPLCVNATAGKFRVGFEGGGQTVLLTDKST